VTLKRAKNGILSAALWENFFLLVSTNRNKVGIVIITRSGAHIFLGADQNG